MKKNENKVSQKSNVSIKNDEIKLLQKSINEMKKTIKKMEKRLSVIDNSSKEKSSKINNTKKPVINKTVVLKPKIQQPKTKTIDSNIEKYINELKDDIEKIKKAKENKNTKLSKKLCVDALEIACDCDGDILRNRSELKNKSSLVNKYKLIKKELEDLVKSIYGDERPVLSEDSIAGDDFYGRF